MRTTTDLSTIRAMPRAFTWGPVQKVHDVGRYTIVEYQQGIESQKGVTAFHVYVDGKDTCQSTTTLEEGLVLAISIGTLGTHSDTARWMAVAMMKLLAPKV